MLKQRKVLRTLLQFLFQMDIDPRLSSTPFAPVNTFGYYSNKEKEILFSMHTIFRIGEMQTLESRFMGSEIDINC